MSDAEKDMDKKFQAVQRWPVHSELEALYANQFTIYRFESEIVIEFGQFLPTGFSNRSQEEIKEYLTEDSNIVPVSRIVLTEHGLEAFYNMLKSNIESVE